MLVLFFALALVGARTMPAQTYTTLYSFTGGSDGSNPMANVIRDSAGNLYGTTTAGGNGNNGVVFKVTPSGVESVLHPFSGLADGSNPQAGLLRDATGNLYGTTYFGGNPFGAGQGVVFKLDQNNNETVLHIFGGYPTDGGNPQAPLIRDSAGNLYGTTTAGGEFNAGTVFKLDPQGTETILYSFRGYPTDGACPKGGLVRDALGNLYGTTTGGGLVGAGVVYELTAASSETMLHAFTGQSDGSLPFGTLLRDGKGNLYGTTAGGGVGGINCAVDGCGVIFKVNPAGKLAVLHAFTGANDGKEPFAGLVRDRSGNLYGTTLLGGTSDFGTVFKLDATGTVTILHSSTFVPPDGAIPEAGLVIDSSGNLYGTTDQSGQDIGFGTVFEVTP